MCRIRLRLVKRHFHFFIEKENSIFYQFASFVVFVQKSFDFFFPKPFLMSVLQDSKDSREPGFNVCSEEALGI